MPSSTSPAAEVLTRPQRIVFGLLLLLVVDIIWVASAEFTEYIFHDLKYDKPFFSTYFKTSLFMVYLTGFVFYRPWRQQLTADPGASALAAAIVRRSGDNGRRSRNNGGQRYERVNDADVDDDDSEIESGEIAESGEGFANGNAGAGRGQSSSNEMRQGLQRALSSPTYIPANIPESGKSSGTESEPDTPRRPRRVRFQNLAQVVEMNPGDALYANLARLSYSASLRAQAALRRAASRLTVGEVLQLSLLFCFPWFVGNYCYQAALSDTEAAVVQVLSSSSCLFTLILAAVFPSEEGDRITLSKFSAVCFSMAGVALVCYSDLSVEGGDIPAGALWTILGAFCYSVYIVLLRRRVSHEDNMDSPMFFGFVGMFNALMLWPGIIGLHFSGKETFEVPTWRQLQFLVINGIIGTVFSELLWLWGCFLTSSLVATLSISLTVPLSILADIVWKEKRYGPLFFAGAVPMFCSYFIVALLTHFEDWDPLLDLLRAICRKCCGGCCGRRPSLRRPLGDPDGDEISSGINGEFGGGNAFPQERQLLIENESSQDDVAI